LDGVLDHREGLETEEIEFRQADGLDVVHGELGGQRFILGPLVKRHPLVQGNVGDHHPRRMGGRMTIQTFQRLGIRQQLLDPFVLLSLLLQTRFHFQGVGQGDIRDIGNHLGDGVHLSIGDVHRPAHVPDYLLGQHLAEGNDLCHIVASVFLRYIADDIVPTFLAEIDVDIRHAFAIGIQEPFEEKAVTDGIDPSDPDGIGHQTAGGGSSARSHGNAVASRVIYKIRHDEKIPGEAHGFDHGQLFV